MAASGGPLNSWKLAGSNCIERYWGCCRVSTASIPRRCKGWPTGLRAVKPIPAYRAVEALLSHVLGEIAICAVGGGTGRQFSPNSDRILRRLCARAPAARWAELREQIAAIFARGNALNLDRKQTFSAPSRHRADCALDRHLPCCAEQHCGVAGSGQAALPYLGFGGHYDCRPAIFFDHADLLRQRPASSRSRLHDRSLRRAGPISCGWTVGMSDF